MSFVILSCISSTVFWGLQISITLPLIKIKRTSLYQKFQGEHYSVGMSFPTKVFIDFSDVKCYYQIMVLGFGLTVHFYKTKKKGVKNDAVTRNT